MLQSHVILLISVTIMYSVAMPLIYFVSSILLFGLYWVSKYAITKYTRHSSHFDESLIVMSYHLLTLAFVVHFAITAEML